MSTDTKICLDCCTEVREPRTQTWIHCPLCGGPLAYVGEAERIEREIREDEAGEVDGAAAFEKARFDMVGAVNNFLGHLNGPSRW